MLCFVVLFFFVCFRNWQDLSYFIISVLCSHYSFWCSRYPVKDSGFRLLCFFDGFLAFRYNGLFQVQLVPFLPKTWVSPLSRVLIPFTEKMHLGMTVWTLGIRLASRTFQDTELENTQVLGKQWSMTLC